MKRSMIFVIIALMGIALIGLSTFQVYWINNAIELNKKAFNENVMASLRQVVDNLERKEVAHFATQSLSVFNIKSEKENLKFIYREERKKSDGSTEITIDHDSLPVAEKHLKRIDAVNVLDPITSVKPPRMPPKMGVVVDSNSIQGDVYLKSHMVNVIIEQLIDPISIHERINHQTLDSLISTTLSNNGIDTKYEFAVWDSNEDLVVTTNAVNNTSEIKQSDLRAALFPSDIVSGTNYLMLNFPDKTSYLYQQISTTLLASVIFILIIVSCFSYAIYIILRQKKLSEMKNDFINNMTHEFKTPIATVGLAVEALGEAQIRQNESTLLRYVGMIGEENNRLSTQVEKVLQSAILDKETFEMKNERLSIHALIASAIEKSAIPIENRNGIIKKKLAAKNDLIRGDKHHLTNVLLNIIDNAIKYSVDVPSITIGTINLTSHIEIRISDKGIGMAKEALKNVFDKFYRVHTGNRHDVKGFGLGLSYVKTIIEKHSGTVNVESELNKGSTFKIILPNEG